MNTKYRLLLLLLLAASAAKADYINDGKHQYYGAIRHIDSAGVKIQIGCNGAMLSFAWRSIMSITFDSQCSNTAPEWTSSPVTANLNCKKVNLFTVKFKGQPSESYATKLKFENGQLVVTFYNNKGNYTVSPAHLNDQVEWMLYGPICKTDLPADFPVPH